MKTLLKALPFLVAMAATGATQAHVAVQPATAVAGAQETLRFVVGHGCDGQPTTALRVELPPGVSSVEPQAKDGWTVAVDRVRGGAVTWRGGELPPHQPDAFSIRARLPSTAGPLSFVAIQTCGAVTVRWDEAATPGGARPSHPAPSLTLTLDGQTAPAAPPGNERLPNGVQRQPDGTLADAAGAALYTFNYDTMIGMSHCEDDCARMWPPLAAPRTAKPFGDWSVIPRPDGSAQWAYKNKPLYTYSQDRPGQPARGLDAPNWTRAK
jgi:predicted lipoprotein with Yx(FWY)xxD motif